MPLAYRQAGMPEYPPIPSFGVSDFRLRTSQNVLTKLELLSSPLPSPKRGNPTVKSPWGGFRGRSQSSLNWNCSPTLTSSQKAKDQFFRPILLGKKSRGFMQTSFGIKIKFYIIKVCRCPVIMSISRSDLP